MRKKRLSCSAGWIPWLERTRRVWAGFGETMSKDMKWTCIGSTPVSGTYNGLDEVANSLSARALLWRRPRGFWPAGPRSVLRVRIKVKDVTALEDGRVLVHCTSDGRGKNGVPYINEYAWVITVQGDKIVSMYEFADTALIERAMFDKRIVPAEALSRRAPVRRRDGGVGQERLRRGRCTCLDGSVVRPNSCADGSVHIQRSRTAAHRGRECCRRAHESVDVQWSRLAECGLSWR